MNHNRASTAFVVVAAVAVVAALLAFGQLGATVRAQAQTPEPPPGATRVREADGAVMVYVPAGEFLMGSPEGEGKDDERPQHHVYLDGFWIDRTEVTNGAYGKCIQAGTCREPFWYREVGASAPDQPVIGVNWNDALTYCQWSSTRLPTEAEWEKAARGTDGRRYPWGEQDASCKYAVMDEQGDACGDNWAPAVGSRPSGASPYGALDTMGSVTEWVADWYAADYYADSPTQNPSGPAAGKNKIQRGGSYGSPLAYMPAAATRYWDNPLFENIDVGFRCAVSAGALPVPTAVPVATPRKADLHAVWGNSAIDVFAVGDAGTLLHYDGTAWSAMQSGTEMHLWGVWGASGSDVYAVGDQGTLLHYDGHAWLPLSSGTTRSLETVWGSSGSDVFIVGISGTLLHHDGSTVAPVAISSLVLYLLDMWGSSADDVFVVGERGTILHYDGSAWLPLDSGTIETLWAVWGSRDGNVFVAGEGGVILHYDGKVWVRTDSSTTRGAFFGLWGSSGNDIFAVGSNGMVVHYDGAAWSQMDSGTTHDLESVWGSSGNDVFAVGVNGRILHYDGAAWSQMSWQ